MTPEHTKKVFRDMRALVAGYMANSMPPEDIVAQRFDEPNVGLVQIEMHLLYCCEEGQRLVDQGRIEKAMRWLGWIQGVLYAKGYATLKELKELNMPPDELPGGETR